MLSANIITLPKIGKESVSPQNFHPISITLLLNTDLKLYMKVMAKRLAPIMHRIVHPDQVGFTLGRQAPDATIFDMLDGEKAFDMIHWGYLKHNLPNLTKCYFQGNILSAILVPYSNPSA